MDAAIYLPRINKFIAVFNGFKPLRKKGSQTKVSGNLFDYFNISMLILTITFLTGDSTPLL